MCWDQQILANNIPVELSNSQATIINEACSLRNTSVSLLVIWADIWKLIKPGLLIWFECFCMFPIIDIYCLKNLTNFVLLMITIWVQATSGGQNIKILIEIKIFVRVGACFGSGEWAGQHTVFKLNFYIWIAY